MTFGLWKVMWEVRDHYEDFISHNSDEGELIGFYDDAEKAAKIAITHKHAPFLSVQMTLIKKNQKQKEGD